MHLNANIPYIRCFVRDAYLYDNFSNKELTECYVFGVKSVINRPLLFHCQLKNGAVFWSLPLSALVSKREFDLLSEDENERLSYVQWWDMQSNGLSVTTFTYLQNYTVEAKMRNGNWLTGKYLFTVDNYYPDNNALPSGYANDPDSKCFHIIETTCGNLIAYPNTFLRWHNLNFVDPYDKDNPPRYHPNKFNLQSEYITTKSTD